MANHTSGYKLGSRSATKPCPTCGTPFKYFKSRPPKNCSRQCAVAAGGGMLGKKHSEATKDKLRYDGKNNPRRRESWFKPGHRLWDNENVKKSWFKPGTRPANWQGGQRSISQRLKDDPRYKIWRKSVFERDNYTCQLCFKIGGYLQSDHIRAKAKYPELAFDTSNGRALCIPCHQKTPNYGSKATTYENIYS